MNIRICATCGCRMVRDMGSSDRAKLGLAASASKGECWRCYQRLRRTLTNPDTTYEYNGRALLLKTGRYGKALTAALPDDGIIDEIAVERVALEGPSAGARLTPRELRCVVWRLAVTGCSDKAIADALGVPNAGRWAARTLVANYRRSQGINAGQESGRAA